MLQLLFLTIILYIIIQHLMEETDDNKQEKKVTKIIQSKKEFIRTPAPVNVFPDILQNDKANNNSGMVTINEKPKILSEGKIKENFGQTKQKSQVKEYVFDKPNPWSKIILDPSKEYPYFFYIKVKIPSLNDFQNWKLVVPNLEFDPRTGELIIPSQDEPSAIALANLIVINFSGQISLKDILDKNLISISVSKAKSFELVLNKLREQIMENLYGKQFNISPTNFEKDLAKKQESFIDVNNDTNKIDFQSEYNN